jgi:hypothetical protein
MGQRRFPRVSESYALLVRRVGPGNPEGLFKTNNLGLGGCEFHSDSGFGVGSRLDVLISIERRVICVSGRVVYERKGADGGFGVGVEFRRVPARAKEMLESLFELEGLRCVPEMDCTAVA